MDTQTYTRDEIARRYTCRTYIPCHEKNRNINEAIAYKFSVKLLTIQRYLWEIKEGGRVREGRRKEERIEGVEERKKRRGNGNGNVPHITSE